MPVPSPRQQQISFAPVGSVSSPRTTPRRSAAVDYHRLHNGPDARRRPENASPARTPARTPAGRTPACTPATRRNVPPVPPFNARTPAPAGSPSHGNSSSDEDEPNDSPTANRPPIRTLGHITTRQIRSGKSRKSRAEHSWTLHYYDVSLLDDIYKRNKKETRNRLWTCKYCYWTTTDKKMCGNKTAVNNHLVHDHKHSKQDHHEGKAVTHGVTRGQAPQQSRLQATVMPKPLGAKEALIQFMALENQPFTICDSQAMKNVYLSVGSSIPISNADSAHNDTAARFETYRIQLKSELKDIQSFSISFDGWGAGNHKHILGVIAHWITKDWERQSATIEFTEMIGKSGEAMAKILLQSFGPDFETTDITEKDGTRITRVDKHIGLDILDKLFAVTGDGAKPNNTMCDHLLNGLEDHYRSILDENGYSPRFKFRGRKSRIHCIAHIIAVLCSDVLEVLEAGTYAEAAELLQTSLDNGYFSPDCNAMSIFRKVRTIVLFIISSDERYYAWSQICSVLIPLDVKTRWNSLYLMMSAARIHKESIVQYIRKFPQLQPLLPTTAEWKVCEILERCLQPFFNYTLEVSKAEPCLKETLGVIWGLDDLMDDVFKTDGQFGDVGADLRNAFRAGRSKLTEYEHKIISKNILYHAAQVLDPRIKFTLIRDNCGNDAPELESRIKDWIRKEYPTQRQPSAAAAANSDACPPGMSQVEWRLLLNSRRPNQQQPMDDIDAFFNSPPVDWDPHSPIWKKPDAHLDWWKLHEHEYPRVAKAAKDIFVVPGAEIDVERLFCGGKDQLGVRRGRLTAEAMRWLTLLKDHFGRLLNARQVQLPDLPPHLRLYNLLVEGPEDPMMM